MQKNKFEDFLTFIISTNYIKKEYYISTGIMPSEEYAKNQQNKIVNTFKSIFSLENYIFDYNDEKIVIDRMIENNSDIIATGGFAVVKFADKNKSYVVKELKKDIINDENILRFQREFDITNELSDVEGVIKVNDYIKDDKNKIYSYKMPYYKTTLKELINENLATKNEKISIIYEILLIMSNVHKKNKIHRDLKPVNIFVNNMKVIISDFGIGKRIYTDNTTITTNTGEGFYSEYYCAPEQYNNFKDADKRSDVFSIGRIVNFILTGNPLNDNHDFKFMVKISTNINKDGRYSDASEMLSAFNKFKDKFDYEIVIKDILLNVLSNVSTKDDEYLLFSNIKGFDLCNLINDNYTKIIDKLINFIISDSEYEKDVISKIKNSFKEYANNYEKYDKIAEFCMELVCNENIVDKETPAKIIRYIASDRGPRRFYVRDILIPQNLRYINDEYIKSILNGKVTFYNI